MRNKIYLIGLLFLALFIPPLACQMGGLKKNAVLLSGFVWAAGFIVFFTLFAGVGLALSLLATVISWFFLLTNLK